MTRQLFRYTRSKVSNGFISDACTKRAISTWRWPRNYSVSTLFFGRVVQYDLFMNFPIICSSSCIITPAALLTWRRSVVPVSILLGTLGVSRVESHSFFHTSRISFYFSFCTSISMINTRSNSERNMEGSCDERSNPFNGWNHKIWGQKLFFYAFDDPVRTTHFSRSNSKEWKRKCT